jgi:hypothetical protein
VEQNLFISQTKKLLQPKNREQSAINIHISALNSCKWLMDSSFPSSPAILKNAYHQVDAVIDVADRVHCKFATQGDAVLFSP